MHGGGGQVWQGVMHDTGECMQERWPLKQVVRIPGMHSS